MSTDPSADPNYQAALALHRFGLGPKPAPMPGSIAAVAADPRGALLAEIERPGAGLIADASLQSSTKASMAAFNFRQQRLAAQMAAEAADKARTDAMGVTPREPGGASKPADSGKPARAAGAGAAEEPNIRQRIVRGETRARFVAANTAEIGFVERLVWFWSNHFCVSTGVVLYMAGGYEREAIRPHVLGRFADMLAAAESHPATQRLTRSRFQVVASPAYFAAHGRPPTIEDIARHNCLGFTPRETQRPREWRFRRGGADVGVTPTGTMSFSDAGALAAAAIAGYGLAQMRDYYTDGAIASGELVPVLEKFKPEPDPVSLVYPQTRHLSPKVRVFIDFMLARFR